MNRINLSQVRQCNQVWEEMTPNEQGRLCQKCSKTIIDFRSLTDKEVAEIHTFSSEPVCGLYIERQLKPPTEWSVEKQGSSWKSLYFGLGGLLLSNTLAAQEVVDTGNVIQVEKDYDGIEKEPLVNEEKENLQKDSVIISGILLDEYDEALIFASVSIKGTKIGVTTDFDGTYSINITEQIEKNNQIVLVFKYVGYASQEVIIDKEKIEQKGERTLFIKLKSGLIMGEFVVKKLPFHKRVWYKIRNVFRRRHH